MKYTIRVFCILLCLLLLPIPLPATADSLAFDERGVLFSYDMKTLLRYPKDRDELSYTIPDMVEVIAPRAFEGSKLEQISFPNVWTYEKEMAIGDQAFANCLKLQYIYLPYYIHSIGDDVFMGTPDELPVIVGDGSVAHHYLLNQSSGTNIHIQWIYDELDMSSWEMASVSLNHYPQEIAWGGYHVHEHVMFFDFDLIAYPSANKADTYMLPKFVHAVKTSSLISPNMKKLRINKDCRSIEPQYQDEAVSLEAIEVESGSYHFTSVDGVLFSFAMTRLHLYPAARERDVYEVPKGVLSLADSCFSGSRIRRIVLPEGLRVMGFGVFQDTQAEEINIPDSVEEFDFLDFEDWPSLKTIHISHDSEAYKIFEINKEYIDFSNKFIFTD